MPITVNDLKRHASDSPPDARKSIVAAMQSLIDAFGPQQADLVRDSIAAEGVRLRAEAQARQVPLELRKLALQHSEALKQMREESDAAARKYFWKGVALTLLITALFTLVGWLLSALNAVQVLSNLFHH